MLGCCRLELLDGVHQSTPARLSFLRVRGADELSAVQRVEEEAVKSTLDGRLRQSPPVPTATTVGG